VLTQIFTPNQLNIYLYFSVGLPFLLWDLVLRQNHLLPRPLAFLALILGAVCLYILSFKVFLLTVSSSSFLMLALILYKRIRLHRMLIVFAAGALLSLLLIYWMSKLPVFAVLKEKILAELAVQMRFIDESRAEIEKNLVLGAGIGITKIHQGIAARILSESGFVGLALYSAFFLSLLKNLITIRREPRIVVSNVAFISVVVFILVGSRFLSNPYTPIVWVWYGIWGLLAITQKKKRGA
jgi:hypothetical protein